MATENDKQDESGGKIEVSGKGWRAHVPTVLIVGIMTTLSNGGATAGCSRQDEILRKLDTIEKKVDNLDRDGRNLDRRLSRLEGSRGAPSQ